MAHYESEPAREAREEFEELHNAWLDGAVVDSRKLNTLKRRWHHLRDLDANLERIVRSQITPVSVFVLTPPTGRITVYRDERDANEAAEDGDAIIEECEVQ